jgi:hypothetical protein
MTSIRRHDSLRSDELRVRARCEVDVSCRRGRGALGRGGAVVELHLRPLQTGLTLAYARGHPAERRIEKPETRAERIERFVAMCGRHETLHPPRRR